jgi:CheY-like chemotaxis protein
MQHKVEQGTKILIVDDEPAICNNLEAFFEDDGIQTYSARSAEEAIDLIAGGLDIDVCIMDLRLPGMNGADGIRRICTFAPEVRFIIHTGSLDEAVDATLRRTGLKGIPVFRKPVEDLALLAQAALDLCSHES